MCKNEDQPRAKLEVLDPIELDWGLAWWDAEEFYGDMDDDLEGDDS